MDSFEELGLASELVDILAAEGFERPTPFQEQALPVVRRGNNLVGRAGPGAGTLLAWGAGLVERLALAGDGDASDEAEEGEAERPVASPGPRALVLTATPDVAERLATSLARIAAPVDLRVATLHGAWVLPERADVVLGTARDLLEWVREGRGSLGRVEAVVVDQLTVVASLDGLAELETLFEFVDADAQRVILDVPVRDVRAREAREAADDFVKRHLRRSVTVPPRSAGEEPDVPARGTLAYRIVEEPRDDGGLELVAEILDGADVRHLAVFFRDEDRAADVGDLLALHGYGVGAPGDTSVPVWLAVEEMPARNAMDQAEDAEAVAALSWDVPAGPDSMDRRHGGERGGWVLLLPREVSHLRDVARRTGYGLEPSPPPAETRIPDDLVRTVEAVARAVEEEDVGAYLLVLETLFETHDPAEVAAAAVALLRKKGAVVPAAAASAPGAAPTSGGTPGAARGPAFVRLFMSLGHKDGAGPGDIVGAITGETRVDGSKVGRIEIKDTFSIVEVEEDVAERVIGGLNGTTVKGRSVRVDYDRGGRGGGRGGGGGGSRRGGPARSGGSRGRSDDRGRGER